MTQQVTIQIQGATKTGKTQLGILLVEVFRQRGFKVNYSADHHQPLIVEDIVMHEKALIDLAGKIEVVVEEVQTAREEEEDKGIYIPKNLDDALSHLEKVLTKEDKEKIEQMESSKDMTGYHFGFGRQLRNDWGLWAESRLALWFNEQGIHHADDMSGIILDSLWSHINKKPIELDKQIKVYQDYWKEHSVS